MSKSLASCCQMCYIENRKGKPETRLTRILKLNLLKVSRHYCE
ncbi:hypothetical protein BRYFOR_07495 [Marvinbryantia formatexigens DSM 14469]|uniref:Uncharacterized protein n=1 Tax=Marvinbryantia formatexigens DSM 14469 TaxID=478749 RepID=C6LFT6_9FIRM|nr:hypothetical protein BRYFOR_07495 [Marvinbryantia formatexigens DSM 14469]